MITREQCDQSLVSIIILNYNGKKFLKKLFETLLTQTYKNFEIIFVDNGSEDGSVEFLNENLERPDFRNMNVTIVRNDQNVGFCEGNNVGIGHVNGELIVFLNNDTYLAKNWLKNLIGLLEKYPHIGAAQSLIVSPSGELDNAGYLRDLYGWGQRIIPVKLDQDAIVGCYQLMGASMVIRRSVLIKCGVFDNRLIYGDFDLSFRILLEGYQVGTAMTSICYHFGSETLKKVFKREEHEFKRCVERIRIILKYYPTGKLASALLISFAMMSLEHCYYSIKEKRSFLPLLAMALFWHVKNFKETLKLRQENHKRRCFSFDTLDGKWLTHYPLLFQSFTDINGKGSDQAKLAVN